MGNDADLVVPNLWLGNKYAACNENFIQTNQIRCIINVSLNIPNCFDFYYNIKYLRIPVENRLKDICIFQSFLDTSYKLIDECLEKGEGILVHCKRGHRRSVMVVTYYLMKKYKLDYDEVKNYIKCARPSAFKCPIYLKAAFI